MSNKKHDEPLAEELNVAGKQPVRSKEEQAKMTAEDCCDLLRAMVEAEPERVLTRNYFRVNSGIKESTWNKFFGSFKEFKAGAGVTLSRGQNRLLLDIAKHASADTYRALNKERRSYGKKYLKPTSGRWKTLLVGSDFHDIDTDPFALRVFLDTAKRLSHVITDVVFAGDVFGCSEFGRWTSDPREWNAPGRMDHTHTKILKPTREALPDARIDLVSGNHEDWIMRHMADATPALKAVLSDFHGMNLADFFGLDKYEINLVAKGDLSAGSWRKSEAKKEVAKNWRIYYNCFLAHHFLEGRKKGLPGVSGHLHKWRVWSYDSPVYGPYCWVQLGCMCRREASFMDAETWNQGFALVHVDTKTKAVQFEYVPIGQTFALSAGKFYERGKNE